MGFVMQVAKGEAATEDSPPVAALRAAGAILIGKANMHEVGIGITGLNLIHGTPRNPVNPNHHTGGSSSGTCAVVASGICPIALGTNRNEKPMQPSTASAWLVVTSRCL